MIGGSVGPVVLPVVFALPVPPLPPAAVASVPVVAVFELVAVSAPAPPPVVSPPTPVAPIAPVLLAPVWVPLELELVTALVPLSVPDVLEAFPLVALVKLADSVDVSVPVPVPVAVAAPLPEACSSPQAISAAAEIMEQTLARKRDGQARPVSSERIMVGSRFAAASKHCHDRYDTAVQRQRGEVENRLCACN